MSRPTNIELLHRLWSKAVGTEDYVKAEWRALEAALLRSPTCKALARDPGNSDLSVTKSKDPAPLQTTNHLIALIRARALPKWALWALHEHADTDPIVRDFIEEMGSARPINEVLPGLKDLTPGQWGELLLLLNVEPSDYPSPAFGADLLNYLLETPGRAGDLTRCLELVRGS